MNATSSNKAAASALFAEALKQVGAKGNERKTAYELARDINEVQTLAKEVASEDFTGYFVRKMNFGDAPPPAFITGDPVFLSDRNGRLSGISVATLAERREEGRAALIAKYGKPDNISERTEILRSGGEVLLETLIWNRPDVIVRYEPVRSDTIGLPPEKWSG